MSRSRRSALKTITAVAVAGPAAAQHVHEAGPLLQIAVPAKPVGPTFFSAAEREIVAILVDLIIPRTGTPGATDAGVPGIIDRSLKNSLQGQEQWREGLRWFAAEMTRPDASALAIITRASKEGGTPGAKFFVLLKGATVDAYYATREGLQTELGWNANTFLSEFKGCTHPEHQV